MDLKHLRRSCAELVDDLDLPVPAEPAELIDRLCSRMEERRGNSVRQRYVRFPAGGPSGLWVSTDSVDYILCEQDTSPWHQLAIACHEFGHMASGHEATPVLGDEALRLVFPSLDPALVSRMVGRTRYTAVEEQEAEIFGSLLLKKLSRWLPERTWEVPDEAVGLIGRLETSLGYRPGRGGRG